jgi:hypothetical protein
MGTTRRRIGEIMVERGLVTAEQLDMGLRNQVVHGGRIGTNLIELFGLDLDYVADALGRQHRMPAARQKHFERCSSDVQRRLPAALAERWKAVPIGVISGANTRRVAIAAIDPLPAEAVAELSEALQLEVMIAVAPELRVLYYLETVYGLPRPNRYKRPPTPQSLPAQGAETAAEGDPGRERRRFIRVVTEAGVEEDRTPVLAKIDIRRAQPGLMVGERTPSRDLSTFEDTISAIRSATGRDLVGDFVVTLLRDGFDQCLDVGLLLVVRQSVAIGWKGFVRDREIELVDALAIPLDEPSLVAEVYRRRAPYLGDALADSLVEQRMWQLLDVPPAAQVVVVPVELFGDIVCLIYATSATAGAIATPVAENLAEVGKTMSAAFVRLVRAAQR